MKLKIVISGGQLGADLAGITAAKDFGLTTGGMMPKGFRRLDGYHPEMADKFGMTEHALSSYPPRTKCNVVISQATIRFAGSFSSPGEICTLRAITESHKPYYDIPFVISKELRCDQSISLGNWIDSQKVVVLNIAGNTPHTCPGIYEHVYEVLTLTFEYLDIL